MNNDPRNSPDDDFSDETPRAPWGRRVLIATVAGVALGAVVGVMGVRTLEPGRPGQPDSLQMLLDSVAKSQASVDTPAALQIGKTDSLATTPPPATDTGTVAVPDLADVQEGDARTRLESAGFTVGTVVFQSSAKAAGTVLSTFPIAGERVALPATVNLILSDGRGRRDSLSFPANTSP